MTLNGGRIQTERLKFLFPEGHSFNLAQMIQQSLRATVNQQNTKWVKSKDKLNKLYLSGVTYCELYTPLQVTNNKFLNTGVGGINGLTQHLQALGG